MTALRATALVLAIIIMAALIVLGVLLVVHRNDFTGCRIWNIPTQQWVRCGS